MNVNEITQNEVPELKVLGVSKSQQIKNVFEPMSVMLEGFESEYNRIIELYKDGISDELAAEAKALRGNIGKIRIATEKERVAQKKEYLLGGRAVDGIGNILKWAISGKEDILKGIENHKERLKKEIADKLQEERQELLLPYMEDAKELDLSSMASDVWVLYLARKKKDFEDLKQSELDAEKEKLEKEKKEDARVEQLRVDNEQLKLEAVEREKDIAKSKKVESDSRKSLEGRIAVFENAAKKKKRTPNNDKGSDNEKLLSVWSIISDIEMPEMNTEEGKLIAKNVDSLLNKVCDYITKKTIS